MNKQSNCRNAFAANVLPVVRQIQASGATTIRAIAEALNARCIRTAPGGQWHAVTVQNLLARGRGIPKESCRAPSG